MDPKREVSGLDGKVTRSRAVDRPEIFPRVIEEPQPVADAVLVQPQVTECLAGAPELLREDFSVDLSGRISDVGRVGETRATGIESRAARCLERALEDILLLPNAPGVFRLNLSRRPRHAGPGVIVDPGGGKKFE